jgi:hypothetical protein
MALGRSSRRPSSRRGEARSERAAGRIVEGLPRGVEADDRLADPCDQRSRATQGDHRVADASAGLWHEAGDVADRNVRAHAAFVNDNQGAVEQVECRFSTSNIDEWSLGGMGARRREPGQSAAPYPLTRSSLLA